MKLLPSWISFGRRTTSRVGATDYTNSAFYHLNDLINLFFHMVQSSTWLIRCMPPLKLFSALEFFHLLLTFFSFLFAVQGMLIKFLLTTWTFIYQSFYGNSAGWFVAAIYLPSFLTPKKQIYTLPPDLLHKWQTYLAEQTSWSSNCVILCLAFINLFSSYTLSWLTSSRHVFK